MATYIKNLTDGTDTFLPRTVIEAIKQQSDNTTLTTILQNKMPNVSVTATDNGKFLRVVEGVWAASTVPNANGVSF